MTHSRDQQDLSQSPRSPADAGPSREDLDLDLDDGWTGELVLTDERPDTGLAPDPRDRKWMLIGLGIAGVLAAGFVLVASFGSEPADPQAAEPSVVIESTDTPTPIEAAPAPAATPAPRLAVAEPKSKPRKPPPVPEQPATTFASGTPAAAQPHAAPAIPPPKPTATPTQPQPAATPTQPAPDPALPTPEPAQPQTGDELPDVQAWDDADDDALRELSEPIEPG